MLGAHGQPNQPTAARGAPCADHEGAAPPRFGLEALTDSQNTASHMRTRFEIVNCGHPGNHSETGIRQSRHSAGRGDPTRRRENPCTQASLLHDAVGGHQSKSGFVPWQSRELRATTLGRGLVVAVQDDCIALIPTPPQPVLRALVLRQAIFVLEPRRDEKRERNAPLVQLTGELRRVLASVVLDSAHRHDQCSRHATSLAHQGERGSTAELIASKRRWFPSAGSCRSQRGPRAHPVPYADGIDW